MLDCLSARLLLSGVLTNPLDSLQVQQTSFSPDVAAAAHKEAKKPTEAALGMWADKQASGRHSHV